MLIKVGRLAGLAPERIAENGSTFAWHHASKLDSPVLEPSVRRFSRGCGTEIDCPGHMPTRRKLAEVGDLVVELHWQRVGPVHVTLDNRRPVVRKIARELELHAWAVYRDGAGENQRILVTFDPQGGDNGRHEAQNAACALALQQR